MAGERGRLKLLRGSSDERGGRGEREEDQKYSLREGKFIYVGVTYY